MWCCTQQSRVIDQCLVLDLLPRAGQEAATSGAAVQPLRGTKLVAYLARQAATQLETKTNTAYITPLLPYVNRALSAHALSSRQWRGTIPWEHLVLLKGDVHTSLIRVFVNNLSDEFYRACPLSFLPWDYNCCVTRSARVF